jgi:hypothetical protein
MEQSTNGIKHRQIHPKVESDHIDKNAVTSTASASGYVSYD